MAPNASSSTLKYSTTEMESSSGNSTTSAGGSSSTTSNRESVMGCRPKSPPTSQKTSFITVKELTDFELDVFEIRERNRTLRRQVQMFQALMKDKEKLNEVIARLEKENLISD